MELVYFDFSLYAQAVMNGGSVGSVLSHLTAEQQPGNQRGFDAFFCPSNFDVSVLPGFWLHVAGGSAGREDEPSP